MTNLQACQSFRRLVSPMTGILGIKKSAPSKKHKQTVSSDASQTKQTPSKSSVGALYLAILIQKIGLLSVRYRTNRRVTPVLTEGIDLQSLSVDERKKLADELRKGSAHETEYKVRLGVAEDRSTKRRRSRIRLQCVLRDHWYWKTRFLLRRIALRRTKIRTFIHEEISLLTVLYFPFRARTPS